MPRRENNFTLTQAIRYFAAASMRRSSAANLPFRRVFGGPGSISSRSQRKRTLWARSCAWRLCARTGQGRSGAIRRGADRLSRMTDEVAHVFYLARAACCASARSPVHGGLLRAAQESPASGRRFGPPGFGAGWLWARDPDAPPPAPDVPAVRPDSAPLRAVPAADGGRTPARRGYGDPRLRCLQQHVGR